MKKVNKHDLKLDDEVFIKAALIERYSISNGRDTGCIFEIDDSNIYDGDMVNGWIPFKGGKCPVDGDTLVTIKNDNGYTTEGAHYFTDGGGKWDSDIVAYQVITPYTPPRRKIVFKNKKEMLTELISRGKLYINEEGEEHVYFSEDDRYTLGYVQEDGRSELANGILDKLEFWVES